MNGIVNVLKPPGMSSHQVVSFFRKQLGIKKVGHTGTLDPGASGVLPLVVGSATRLSEYLVKHEKTYIAELTLGISTTTQDASGDTMAINTDFKITPTHFAEVVASFQGPIWQTPPMASAIKVQGKRLYKLERQGLSVPRKARQIQVYSINIQRIWNHDQKDLSFGTRVLLKVVCSKGTYLRTLGHDIGERLEVGGHISFLSRSQSGPFTSGEAYTLERIKAMVQNRDLSFFLPLEAGLPDWVQVKVNPLVEKRIRHGNFILPRDLLDVPARLVIGDNIILMSIDGEVLALAEIQKKEQLICQPFRVFVEG